MTTYTLCWNCSTQYMISDPICPNCGSANANVNPEQASKEVMGESGFPSIVYDPEGRN